MDGNLKPFDRLWQKANERAVASKKKRDKATMGWIVAKYDQEYKFCLWLCDELKSAFEKANHKKKRG